jgi:hypothetical protein
MKEYIFETFQKSIIITLFVLIMMIVIEYINVQSKNRLFNKLQNSPFIQIIIAAILGITPGCMGAFMVVSLYTHKMVTLGALVAVMIATSGDEAFVMFALFPYKALILHFVLFIIAIISGYTVYLFSKKNKIISQEGYEIHENNYCKCFNSELILPQLKTISFERALFLLSTIITLTLLLFGLIGEPEWNWEKVTLFSGLIFLLFIFITVPDHFLNEHLYNHVIKKHLIKIFLWTFGSLLVLYFVKSNEIVNGFVSENQYIILLLAVVIGIIPESGPHLVFVTMFAQGLIPFSILLTNSIVQDGHGMLPLLAESRKDFIKVKAINILVGLIVGSILWLFKI